ncbi:MAG: response regulator transcription factor [Gammaproteobacteria bacterium]
MKKIRILLADDHHLVRAGIRSLLEGFADMEVVGETGDGREAIALASRCQPDIVLLDISMGAMSGLEAAASIVQDCPQTRVIMLSMHANEEYVRQALQAGASGYLLKDAATNELEIALRAVLRGETYLSPAVSSQLVNLYLSGQTEGASLAPDPLTPRQTEILRLIAEGKTTKQAAALLNLSIKTIETHRAQIMERLDIRDIPGLVRYAVRHGLVDLDA